MNATVFWLTAAMVFVAGAAFGSFYNVLADRIPRGQDFINSRSICESCGTVLKWYDLIPFFSYLSLGGRCRHCGIRLSIQYPLTELAAGLLFVLGFVRRWNTPLVMVIELSLWSMLFITALMDYKSGVIADQILEAFAVIGAVATLFAGQGVLRMFLGALTGFVFYGLIWFVAAKIYKKEAFGMGDVLLLTAIGVFVGPLYTFVIGFLAFYIALLLFPVYKLTAGKKTGDPAIPFGPAICLAAFIMTLFGSQIIDFFRGLLHI